MFVIPRYNDMMDKSIQFVKTHLEYAKGDDYEVREYLTRELSDFINSGRSVSVGWLLD